VRRRSSELLDDVLQRPFLATSPYNHANRTLDVDYGDDFVMDEAEATVVEVLEERQRIASVDYGVPNWKPATLGERPPIPNMPTAYPPRDTSAPSKRWRPRFADAVKRVQRMKSMRSMADVANASMQPSRYTTDTGHTRGSLVFRDNSHSAGGELDNISRIASIPRHRRVKSEAITVTDLLMDDAEALENTFGNDDVFSSFRKPQRSWHTSTESQNTAEDAERLMRNSTDYSTHGPELATHIGDQRPSEVLPLVNAPQYGSTQSLLSTEVAIQKKKPRRWKLVSGVSGLAEVLSADALMQNLRSLLAIVVCIQIPLLCAAFVLFYHLSNPELDFLPGDATVSWWCVFLVRQSVTFELSRRSQYFGVDCLALRSRWVVKIFGPLFTLWLIQARGWPFICTVWALYDCVLLHGDNVFQRNWLFWTDIELFSDANPGADILKHEMYIRILIAAMLAGFLHAAKRTYVALYFGRRTFLNYKPKLEKILGDLVVVTEVAALVSDLEQAEQEIEDELRKGKNFSERRESQSSAISTPGVPARKKREAKWAGVAFHKGSTKGLDTVADDGDDSEADDDDDDGLVTPVPSFSLDDVQQEEKGEGETDRDDDASLAFSSSSADRKGHPQANGSNDGGSDDDASAGGLPESTFSPSSAAIENDMSISAIKLLLEEWEEPVNKLDQKTDATISDMLKFRKALSYMDDEFPFSAEFGPAGTRDQCIESAQKIYRRLADAIDREVCPFAVLESLAEREDGTFNLAKVQRLKRLFRPDRYNEIPNLAFIQSCDAVYKRLRFFRASVGNASVLQQVLEGILDAVFNFVLGLGILAILNFNPWPLLVSCSTLLVSTAFALGPSASRYMEGVLTIAFRRPYDLGDRIMLEGATSRPDHDAARQSWLVEDVNLYSTTLRYAATNEVSTVPNGSIAQSRIINLARSPNALVTVTLRFQLEVEDTKLSIFRHALRKFLRDRPRTWLELAYFRCERVNTEAKWLEYELRVRHAKSWQDGPRILQNRATLIKFCYETGKHLEMNYLGVVNQLEVIDGSNPGNPTAWLTPQEEVGKRVADKKPLLFPQTSS